MLFSYLFGYLCFWFAVYYYFSNFLLVNACAVFISCAYFFCFCCSLLIVIIR